MTTLLNTVPTSIHMQTLYSYRIGGLAEQVHFYYGVEWDCMHLLPIGAVFSAASSPYPDATPETLYAGWWLTAWQVVQTVIRYGKHKGKHERVYQPLSSRALEADEVEHLKSYLRAERVAIVGSRTWQDSAAVFAYVRSLPPGTVVVSGGADGVDTFARLAADEYGYPYKEFPADWQRYGKSAGMRRNAEIVEFADRVVAFWDGVSKGTANTIERARKASKPVEVIAA